MFEMLRGLFAFAIFGDFVHGRTVAFGDLFDVQPETLLLIADQLHRPVHVL